MRSFFVLLICALAGTAHASDKQALTVAISPDIPPYVIGSAGDGLVVAILRGSMPGRALRFVQVPHMEIETTIGNGKADAAALVRSRLKNVFYSKNFIALENAAFTRKADSLVLREVGDLAGKPVLTWQGAWRELGPSFEALFRPGGAERGNLEEFIDQTDQVNSFWSRKAAVAVIDRNIFAYYSRKANRSMDEAALHPIFSPSTAFKVGFREAAARDAFDRGLADLCASGRYAALIERYRAVLRKTVCQ